MNDKVFIDTNVFMYLFSSTEADKRIISINLLKNYTCVTSTQALNEFANASIKKYKLPGEVVKEAVKNIARQCRVSQISEETIYSAIDINKRYGYSFYDCLMLASAIENECKVIYTEDMRNLHIINSNLSIINPYL
jgi:predicted nucleic acid-binding protein